MKEATEAWTKWRGLVFEQSQSENCLIAWSKPTQLEFSLPIKIGSDSIEVMNPEVPKALDSIGWFVPPYVGVSILETVSRQIIAAKGRFDDGRVEQFLAHLYGPDRLASMVVDRYSKTDVVDLYQKTIAEAVAAHFSNFHHIAVAGLMPVVEGIGRELSRLRGLTLGQNPQSHVKDMFTELLTEAKRDAWNKKIGKTQEIDDMLTGSLNFLTKYFFEKSSRYPATDNTNRPGILHGAFRDADYGRPINFYKTISAVDILTFVSMLRMPKMSGFVPPNTPEATALAERFEEMQKASPFPNGHAVGTKWNPFLVL
jgi:hypothetical protein